MIYTRLLDKVKHVQKRNLILFELLHHSMTNNSGTGKMIDKGNSPCVLLWAGCKRRWDWASLKMTVITLLLLTPCN